MSIFSIGPSFFDVANIIIDDIKGMSRANVHMATIIVSMVSSLCSIIIIVLSNESDAALES